MRLVYCLILAVLSDGGLFAKGLLSKIILPPDREFVVLYDPFCHDQESCRPPIAVVARNEGGSYCFSFVDSGGRSVGPRIMI